jgi:hypothetical protein
MSTSSHNLGSLEVKPNGPQTLKIVSPVFVAKIELFGKFLRVLSVRWRMDLDLAYT